MSVYDRVSNFYDEIIKKYGNKNILVVAHSGIGRISSAYFNGFPKDNDFSTIVMQNAEVVEFNNSRI